MGWGGVGGRETEVHFHNTLCDLHFHQLFFITESITSIFGFQGGRGVRRWGGSEVVGWEWVAH